MLSYTKGRPIATIEGGDRDGDIICLVTGDEEKCCKKCGPKCKSAKAKPCCKKSCCGDGDKLFKEIVFHDNDTKLIQVPNIDQEREIAFISGPSGSGKSTNASNYIKQYKLLYPRNEIYVFSRLPEDKVIDDLNVNRVVLDQDLIDNPIDISRELTGGCLCLFDDIDTITDKKLQDAILKLKADIMEIGRHYAITLLSTSHLINSNNKRDCRTTMNESHTITIFPKAGNTYGINYALKNYLGFSKKQIDKIMNLPSRSVTIGKTYPNYVLYDKGVYIP